jgi:hypothetical protein
MRVVPSVISSTKSSYVGEGIHTHRPVALQQTGQLREVRRPGREQMRDLLHGDYTDGRCFCGSV